MVIVSYKLFYGFIRRWHTPRVFTAGAVIYTAFRTTWQFAQAIAQRALDYPYDRIRAFEARASKISYSTPDYREQLDKLIDELIADIIAFAEANPN